MTVEFTHEVADGMHGAIVKAVKTPAGEKGLPVIQPAAKAGCADGGDRRRSRSTTSGRSTGRRSRASTPTGSRPARHLRDRGAELGALGRGAPRGAPLRRAREGEVVGWAAVAPVSDRCVYGGVVENSVYVDERARGRGVGRLLLERLVASTEAAGIWTIQTGIFPENEASLRLHERAGFEVVGRRKRLGQLHGVWRDVLLLERRSDVVG